MEDQNANLEQTEDNALTEDEVRAQIAAEVFEGKQADLPAPVDAEPEGTPDKDIPAEPDEETEPKAPEAEIKEPVTPVIPEELQNQISAMSNKIQEFDTIANRLKQAESRLGAMQNEFYAAKKEAEQKKAEGVKAPSNAEMQTASGSKEAWEDLKTEFPEWAEAFQYRIDQALAGIKPATAQETSPDLETLKQSVQTLSQQAITPQTLQKELLTFKYPDWQQTIKSSDYQVWLQGQSDEIKRKALYGQTAQEAGFVLDEYNKYKNKSKTQQHSNQTRLAQAVNPQTGGKAPRAKSEKDMTEEELRAKIAAEVWGES